MPTPINWRTVGFISGLSRMLLYILGPMLLYIILLYFNSLIITWLTALAEVVSTCFRQLKLIACWKILLNEYY